jgi:hypothetical protein
VDGSSGSIALRGATSSPVDPDERSLLERFLKPKSSNDETNEDVSRGEDEPNEENAQDDARSKNSVTTTETTRTETTIVETTSPSDAQTPEDADVKYYKLVDDELVEIKSLPTVPVRTQDAVNPDASDKINTVLYQAEFIQQAELRDRAYLDVVDFALASDLFSSAKEATQKIEQIELRDTARSRIGVAYALKGDSDAAFAQINAVEVDELRDVMRLQVIEALISPERLPASFR